jgi:hypothetical protein
MKKGASYFGNRSLEHVKEDLLDMKKNGINSVLHTFSEHDIAFYLETMKEIVQASHELGMEVSLSPWGVAGIFGGEAFSKFVGDNYNEWQVLSDGCHVPNICPNSEKLLLFLKEWTDKAVYIGADIVMWDEPHFTRTNDKHIFACRCKRCKALFVEMFKYEMPDKLNEDIEKLRLCSINRLVNSISAYAKDRNLKVSACLLPVMRNDNDMEHWNTVAENPNIDILSTDPYWMFEEGGLDEHYKLGVEGFVEYYSKLIIQLCEKYGKEPQIWIQNFLIKKDREKEVEKAVETAHKSGIRNIFAWSYKGAESMSTLRSDNPEKAWWYYTQALKLYAMEN